MCFEVKKCLRNAFSSDPGIQISPWCPTEGANIKETQSLEENGCKEKCLDKSLLSNDSIFSFFMKTYFTEFTR